MLQNVKERAAFQGLVQRRPVGNTLHSMLRKELIRMVSEAGHEAVQLSGVFNRYTLLGEYDPLFIALLKERCLQDGLDFGRLPDYFRAHMSRGVTLLQQRVRSLSDIADLVSTRQL